MGGLGDLGVIGMHRFLISPDRSRLDQIELDGAEAHHALRVLRIGVGERVALLDGSGSELMGEVIAILRRSIQVQVNERRLHERALPRVTLYQSLIKPKPLEWIVQKGTELGVTRMVMLSTERSRSQLDEERGLGKVEKWRAVASEAMKQCGTPWMPVLGPPRTLVEAIQERDSVQRLDVMGSLGDGTPRLTEVMDRFLDQRGEGIEEVGWWVGPEGDFSPAEGAALEAAGVRPITLGPRVLRAETAAICGVAVLQHELARRGLFKL